MKGHRREWIVLAALVVVMMGVSALLGGRDPDDAREDRANPSTYNARGSGTKGLYLWLQELGLPVRRWESPLVNLPAQATVLLVLGPRVPYEEPELKALEEWIRGGGVLLLADDTVGGPVPGVWAGALAFRFGLQPRTGGKPSTLRPAFPSSYAAGVETIQPTGWVRFQRQRPEGWAPLFADGAGDILAIKRLGEGSIIALTDPGMFSNARLEFAGHARLALNITQENVGRGVILVDEYHHGYGHDSPFFRYLKGTAVPWMLAQAALAFLAFVVARGTRFGPPVPASETPRTSSLEYIGALGDLYRRAGARRLAGDTLAKSFRRSLTEALGARPGEESVKLAARAVRRFGVRAERVKACLEPGPGAMASDDALLKYAQAVHHLEARLRRRAVGPSRDRSGKSV
jgi:hypothetical protein